MYQNLKHKQKVENRGDNYEYIGSYNLGEITIDKKCNKRQSYIRVKCPYCGNEYDVRIDSFVGKLKTKCTNCCNKYENSFAYYIQQELKEPLNKYWDWNENTANPYLISKDNSINVILKCDKVDYHENYKVNVHSFHKGSRCPQCNKNSGKVHPKDSFGALYPEKAKYWSPNNNKSPYEVTPKSRHKYKFICEKCGEEFDRGLDNLNKSDLGVVCNNCNSSQLEQSVKNILNELNIIFKREVSFENLYGLGGLPLRFDFYLPDYNLLIECQGIQHKEWREGWQTKEDFERQLEHDKRKREYAKEHNINLLEIWYYELKDIKNIIYKFLEEKENK